MPVSVAARSVLEHNPDIAVVVLCDSSVDAQDWEKVRASVPAGSSLERITVENPYASFGSTSSLPVSIYLRFLVPSVLGDRFRVALYLDADVVVRGSLDEFFELDFAGCSVIACPDQFWRITGAVITDWARLGVDGHSLYFNSGVMLIDVVRWRERKVTERASELAQTERLLFMDQCALNLALHNDWRPAPLKFNAFHAGLTLTGGLSVLAPADVAEARTSPVISHFCGGSKPWTTPPDSPFVDDWFDTVRRTVFANFRRPETPRPLSLPTRVAGRVRRAATVLTSRSAPRN